LEISGVVVAGRFMFGTLFVDVEAEGTGWVRQRRERIGALTVMCPVNQFAVGPSYQQQVLSAARESGTFGCAMTDQLTIEGITALIAELEARKAALHPKQK
jgi:hypothetical protein